jgi:N-methylhydantoinase B/oxoprolinase/acetone carboxylase alpha subunit
VLHTKETGIEIGPGDCLEVRSGGGGGWGPPAKRGQAARDRDCLQGLVGGADKAFSSELGTGSREENASKRKT